MWTKVQVMMAVAALSVMLTGTLPALAQPPETLHFQGYLTNDAGGPLSGKWSVTFGFYDVQSGGKALWEEKQEIDVVTGVFQVTLGSLPENPLDPVLFEKGGIFLGLTLWDGDQGLELLPRQTVVSNPYSFYSTHAQECVSAQNADTLGGQAVDQFVSVDKVDEVCLTKTNIDQWLLDNGYAPGGAGCTCQWADLKDVPDALVFEDELSLALAGYYDITDIDVMLGNYYTMTEVDGLLAAYLSKVEIEALLSSYYTKADVDGLLAGYYTAAAVDALLTGYYTKAAVDALLGGFVTKAAVDALIAGLATKDHNHDGLYMADDKGAVDKAADFNLSAPTSVKNLDADTLDGKHANQFEAATVPSPYLVGDSDWFTFPNRTSLPVTVGISDANLLFVVARSTEQGAQVTTPIMGANSESYASAYSAFDGKVATLRTETYVAAINSFGDGQNLLLNNGMGRILALKKTADFDSGWQTCAAGNTYVHQHNLGSLPTIAYVEVAQNQDGSGWRTVTMSASNNNGVGWRQTAIVQMDDVKVTMRTQTRLCEMRSTTGASVSPTSGFCRVQLWTMAPDFDSGWTALSTAVGNRDKWFRHDFHRFPSLVMVYVAQNADGTGWLIPAMGSYHQNYTNGTGVYDINEAWITIKGGSSNVADFVNSNGSSLSPTSGFVRVMAWK